MCRLGLVHTEDCLCQTDTVTGPQWVPRAYSTALDPSPEQQERDSVSVPHGKRRLPMTMSDWHSDRPAVSHQSMFYNSVLPPLQSSKNATVSVSASPMEQHHKNSCGATWRTFWTSIFICTTSLTIWGRTILKCRRRSYLKRLKGNHAYLALKAKVKTRYG